MASWEKAPLVSGGAWQNAPAIDDNPLPHLAPDRSGVGRQIGLSLRAPVDAAADLFGIPGNAFTSAYNLTFGRNVEPASKTYEAAIGRAFPTPETDQERFSNQAARTGYGAGIVSRAAQMAGPVSRAGQGIRNLLTTRVGNQVAGSSTAGGATELLTQGGTDPTVAMALGLGAGVIGGRAYQIGEDAATRLWFSRSTPAAGPTRVADRMQMFAREAGVDLGDLPSSVRTEFEKAVRDSIARNQPLDDVQVERWLKLQQAGVRNPSRGMVTRDPRQWDEEDRLRKLSEIGDPLQKVYDTAGNAIRETLRPRTTPGDLKTGSVIKDSLDDISAKLRGQRDAAYNAAWKSPEASQGVPVQELRQWLNSTRSRWKLNPEYEATLDELTRLVGDRPMLTQRNHEELRKYVNSLKKIDNGGVLRDIKDQVDKVLLDAGQSPAFRDARELHTLYKSVTADQSIVGDLLQKKTWTDPKVWPDQVYERVMGKARAEQIKQLKNTLQVYGKPQAVDTLKDRVREDLLRTLNEGNTTADRAASLIRKINNSREQYSALFEPGEMQQLMAIRDAAESVMTVPRGAAPNTPNTASQIVEYVRTMLGPMWRTVNMVGMGIPGAVVDAGAGSLARSADARRINQAVSPTLSGLLNQPPPSPVLTPGLLGAFYGASSGRDRP
jgi:hypothetical protein